LDKLRASRAKGILIYPYWPLQSWFQEVHRLSAFHFRLPPPHLCVRPHHPGTVEPFVNRQVQLRAAVFDCACVKDGLLQACVLLATQGDNSRIRWSASQECQHVLSSDIKPYNKKLLGTSPALLQDMTLPANFMLHNVSTLAPGFEAGVRLLQGGRRPSTVKSYLRPEMDQVRKLHRASKYRMTQVRHA
jgi:hypothetical protein